MYALLDTSVLVGAEELDLSDYEDHVALVSAVSVGELAFGLNIGTDHGFREARLRRVLADYEILPFGVEEAKLYGVLSTLVRAAGRNPRPRRLDLQIAATAAAARVPLLTTNPADFLGADQLANVVPVKRLG
ncbi:PIN domain-containing protein [Pseudonocardia sp. DLS-67]